MLQGISKARISNKVYTREIETREIEGVDEKGETVVKVEEFWGEWMPKEYDSISKAKKANGRGSIAFSSKSDLPK